jgi:hypothetical protein
MRRLKQCMLIPDFCGWPQPETANETGTKGQTERRRTDSLSPAHRSPGDFEPCRDAWHPRKPRSWRYPDTTSLHRRRLHERTLGCETSPFACHRWADRCAVEPTETRNRKPVTCLYESPPAYPWQLHCQPCCHHRTMRTGLPDSPKTRWKSIPGAVSLSAHGATTRNADQTLTM